MVGLADLSRHLSAQGPRRVHSGVGNVGVGTQPTNRPGLRLCPGGCNDSRSPRYQPAAWMGACWTAAFRRSGDLRCGNRSSSRSEPRARHPNGSRILRGRADVLTASIAGASVVSNSSDAAQLFFPHFVKTPCRKRADVLNSAVEKHSAQIDLPRMCARSDHAPRDRDLSQHCVSPEARKTCCFCLVKP